LIHNFGYAVKQNRNKDPEIFSHSMKAALEHHFDYHKYCNPKWCQFREDSIRKADDSKRQKLRSKNIREYKIMYDAVKVIHLNTTPENLDMLRDMYDSKKMMH